MTRWTVQPGGGGWGVGFVLLVMNLLLLVVAVRRCEGATAFPVGICIRPDASAEQLAAVAATGATWVRTDLAWSHVEQVPGEYSWGDYDRLMDRVHAARLYPLFILAYGHDIHTGGAMLPPRSREAREAFGRFAAGAAARYPSAIFEVWNEPNISRFWAGSPDPAEYVALARDASIAIRRAQPTALVLGPGIGGGAFDLDYLEQALAAGLLDHVDAISVHPYGASEPERATAFYAQVRTAMRRYGREVALVVSEWGYPSWQLSEAEQAAFLTRAIRVNAEARIPLTFLYSLQDDGIEPDPEHRFGLFRADGSAKPAARAVTEALR